MAESFARGAIVLVGAVSALSCASGPATLLGYKVPQWQQVAIVIDISDQVNAADQGGGVATLADTISDRLKEQGILSQLYTSKYDHPKPPRVDLFVSHWHGTAASSHQAAAAGYVVPGASAYALASGGNDIVVDCKVTLPSQEKPAFSRRFEKSGMGIGLTSNEDNAAAANAGNAIVDAILKR